MSAFVDQRTVLVPEGLAGERGVPRRRRLVVELGGAAVDDLESGQLAEAALRGDVVATDAHPPLLVERDRQGDDSRRGVAGRRTGGQRTREHRARRAEVVADQLG